MSDSTDAELVQQAINALRALEARAESLSPGVTEEDDVYPSGDAGMAGLALMYHVMRLGCCLEDAVQHLEEHCRELETLQGDYRKGREEPLRMTLEEIELAAGNHFPPPQVAMNTLNYAIARVTQGDDAYLGEHGGMERASGIEMRERRTKRHRQYLARRFVEMHRQEPAYFPISKIGFGRASAVLEDEGVIGAKPSSIEKALLRSVHHKMLAWPES